MNIYEKPTIKANNYNEIEFFLKNLKKKKLIFFTRLNLSYGKVHL